MALRREFSLPVRQRALLRARYRCQRCGSRDQLELHHRGNCQDNSLFNAEVLCAKCHAAEHERRRLHAKKQLI